MPFQRPSPSYFALKNSTDVHFRVAATKTPIIFLGVGEHLHDLDRFAPQPFISKLLGLGDMQGLMEHMQDMAAANPEKQKEMAKKLEEGKLSLRDWREQIQHVMSMYAPLLSLSYMFRANFRCQGTNQQNCIDDPRPSPRDARRF